MTSEAGYGEAYVWVWLPGETEPVVAGRLAASGGQLVFNYGKSYLGRRNAIPLYAPELPLRSGTLPLLGSTMPGAIRDAAPDAWGRRVIIDRKLGVRGQPDGAGLDELTYLLESSSDRIGALDFQRSATRYVARAAAAAPAATAASLDDLRNAVDHLERGLPLGPELREALFHGSAIGGARPKAAIVRNDKTYIAKLAAQADTYSMVKAEYVAMRLAAEAGIRAASVSLENAGGSDVLLVERFDREQAGRGWKRHAMVSALTLLGLDETLARYAAYEDMATVIRHRFTAPRATLRELFARMLFNVLCGNTDDHARNHAAFWNGHVLTLTPAYDICPQPRTGGAASQAMLIAGEERLSRIATCLEAAPSFLLAGDEALALAAHQIKVVRDQWGPVCAEARLTQVDRNLLWRRQFLNPFAFEGAPAELARLVD
jgi:serine/threonine-protein kinase HipA